MNWCRMRNVGLLRLKAEDSRYFIATPLRGLYVPVLLDSGVNLSRIYSDILSFEMRWNHNRFDLATITLYPESWARTSGNILTLENAISLIFL